MFSVTASTKLDYFPYETISLGEMGRYFTHYWTGQTLDFNPEGGRIGHTAGNRFRTRNIGRGDRIYILNIRSGKVYLIGALTAASPPLSDSDARTLLGEHIWEADDHLVAIPGTDSILRHCREITPAILSQVRFLSVGGQHPLKYKSDGTPDPQSIRGVRELTSASAMLFDGLLDEDSESGSFALLEEIYPSRRETVINRLYRNRAIVTELKTIYNDTCQICSTRIMFRNGSTYSEAHHIRPLGGEHLGSDSLDNLLCVCPNCHVKLDYFSISIDPEKLTVSEGHFLNLANIDYHNQKVVSS